MSAGAEHRGVSGGGVPLPRARPLPAALVRDRLGGLQRPAAAPAPLRLRLQRGAALGHRARVHHDPLQAERTGARARARAACMCVCVHVCVRIKKINKIK